MLRSRPLILLLSFVLTASVCQISTAAPPGITSASDSQLSDEDVMYDFEVYWGEPRYGWFLVWEFGDGSTLAEGPFSSHYEASLWATKLLIYGLEPDGVVDYEIVEQELEPILEYLVTVDTRAEAEVLADLLEGWGFYAEIRKVSIFQTAISR